VRAVWCNVNDGALRSTGSLQLVDTDGNDAYLNGYYSIVELSRDLAISGLYEGMPPLKPKMFFNSWHQFIWFFCFQHLFVGNNFLCDICFLCCRAAYLELDHSEATFGGSINVTAGQYGQAYVAVLYGSRASVAGDITVLGDSYNYNDKKRDNDNDSVEEGEKKRGFSLDGSGLAVDYD